MAKENLKMGKKMCHPSRGASFQKKELVDMIEIQKLQQWKVAEILGVHKATVLRWCKLWNIKCQRTGPRGGDQHHAWKGGTKIVNGYKYVYMPNHLNCTKNKYVLEHRLVMEKKLGRLLHKKEIVHHIDGNPLNNIPENLDLFSMTNEHRAYELLLRIPFLSRSEKTRLQIALDAIPETNPSWLTIQRK